MRKYFLISIFFLSFILASQAQALTLYPSRLEANLKPGQSKEYDLALYNETEEDLYLNAVLTPFETNNEDGLPVFGEFKGDKRFLTWIRLPQNSFVLKSKETKKIKLAINVPENGKPGGYYFAAIWSMGANPTAPGSQVSISSRVGTLVLLKVQGEGAQEKLEIKDFYLARKNILKTLPADFFIRMENKGNVHIKPEGKLVVINLFGRVVDNATFNKNGLNVLPSSTRKMEAIWKGKGLNFGLYKARLDIEYGEGKNRISSKEIYFWVLPWWSLIIIVALIIAILIWIIRLVKGIKRNEK